MPRDLNFLYFSDVDGRAVESGSAQQSTGAPTEKSMVCNRFCAKKRKLLNRIPQKNWNLAELFFC